MKRDFWPTLTSPATRRRMLTSFWRKVMVPPLKRHALMMRIENFHAMFAGKSSRRTLTSQSTREATRVMNERSATMIKGRILNNVAPSLQGRDLSIVSCATNASSQIRISVATSKPTPTSQICKAMVLFSDIMKLFRIVLKHWR